ncbi:MAG: MBL fold metallo-hydrolase [Phycisphaerales bacterium]
MRIQVFGAAGEVTGSCTLIETGQSRVLIDYGMHQGGRDDWQRNFEALPIECERLDAVILTHAHIDHIGRVPLLTRCGYRGPIYATSATCELAVIMLRDAGNLQVADAARASSRRERMGLPPVAPLYTPEDVEPVLGLLKPVEYDRTIDVARGVRARWVEAGHILGSASVELTVAAMGPRPKRTIVFSGDVGPKGMALLRDPAPPSKADLVFLESTYGDRDHRSREATIEELQEIVKNGVWARQKVLIPAFAVGRSQALVYHLGSLERTGRVPKFPICVDSPMAVSAFEVYARHARLYDRAAAELFEAGHEPLAPDGLRLISRAEESKALNTLRGGLVVIAASGMCTGGRILHHLRHNLWKRETSVVIVGYQAHGSLGRRLVDGADTVRIFGDTVAVRARVHTLGGLSAHAGQTELLEWAEHFRGGGLNESASRAGNEGWPRFVLNHGEPAPRAALAARLRERGVARVLEPMRGDVITLDEAPRGGAR